MPRSRQDPVDLLLRLRAKITQHTHTNKISSHCIPDHIVDLYTDLGSTGGTSTLAKNFSLLAALALSDKQRLRFRREEQGVEEEGGSLLAMTLSNYEFNRAKLLLCNVLCPRTHAHSKLRGRADCARWEGSNKHELV